MLWLISIFVRHTHLKWNERMTQGVISKIKITFYQNCESHFQLGRRKLDFFANCSTNVKFSQKHRLIWMNQSPCNFTTTFETNTCRLNPPFFIVLFCFIIFIYENENEKKKTDSIRVFFVAISRVHVVKNIQNTTTSHVMYI